MSTVSARARSSWREIVLLLVGAVLVGPFMFGGERVGVADAATSAKWVSCPGVAFYPLFSGNYDSSIKYGTNVTTGRFGYGVMTCPLTLPAGATVTAVKFHLYDVSAGQNVEACSFNRVKLDPPNGVVQSLAGPLSTSGSPGFVTRTDTSISFSAVKPRYYAYYASCNLPYLTSELGIIGVSVRYVP